MNTTKTRAQLVTRALQKLGIVGEGQSENADDAAQVDASVDAVLADLAARGIIDIAAEDQIEVAVFEWLAICLAGMVAMDFGNSFDPALVERAEYKLRVITSAGPTYETMKVDYF